METALGWLAGWMNTYPGFSTFLACIGALRLIIKPAMTAITAITKATPTKKDDELVDEVFNSKTWKSFLFLLDWLASVKLTRG
jgi:hypothetical protein